MYKQSYNFSVTEIIAVVLLNKVKLIIFAYEY